MRRESFAGQDRKIIPVLLGFLVLSVFALAQDLPTAKPETLGLSSERLERIGTAVQHDIDNKRIAGAVTTGDPARSRRMVQVAGHDGPRGRQSDAAGCDVPNLFHDKAYYQRGSHDALRRGALSAR